MRQGPKGPKGDAGVQGVQGPPGLKVGALERDTSETRLSTDSADNGTRALRTSGREGGAGTVGGDRRIRDAGSRRPERAQGDDLGSRGLIGGERRRRL